MQAKIHNITVKFIFKPLENGMHEDTIDRKIPQMTRLIFGANAPVVCTCAVAPVHRCNDIKPWLFGAHYYMISTNHYFTNKLIWHKKGAFLGTLFYSGAK